MRLAFVSNYFNHHQRALADRLYTLCGGAFTFVATSVMREERRTLGYGESEIPEYVTLALNDTSRRLVADTVMQNADAVIFGAAPQNMLTPCLKARKPVFRYSERLLKNGSEWWKYPYRRMRLHRDNPSSAPLFLLSAGAYAAGDYARFGLFHGRTLRWGYFPALRTYPEPRILMDKKDPTHILWCGRMIDWKHPEQAIKLIGRLRREGLDCHLTMVGSGIMESSLQDKAESGGLGNCVTFTGPRRPEQVRDLMESAGIYLLTSDQREGWGAVVNEAMNSGCAVVATEAAGSVPYLIRDGVSGCICPTGHTNVMEEWVKALLTHPGTQRELGMAALQTISETWNASVAAYRLVQVIEQVLEGNADGAMRLFFDGPCSPADPYPPKYNRRRDI